MPNTSPILLDEVRALLQFRQEAIGHLHAHLEGLASVVPNVVPNLNPAAVQ